MAWFFNILFYNFFRLHRWFGKVLSYPVELLVKTKVHKLYYKWARGGRSYEDDKRLILRMQREAQEICAIGWIYALLMFFSAGIMFFLSGFWEYFFDLNLPNYVLGIVCLGLIGYFELVLYLGGGHEQYFKEFEKMSVQAKRRSAWMTFGVVIGCFIFFIYSSSLSHYIRGGP